MNPWWLRPPADEEPDIEPERNSGGSGTTHDSKDATSRKQKAGPRTENSRTRKSSRSNGRPRRTSSKGSKETPSKERRDRRIGLFCDVEDISLGLRAGGVQNFDIQSVVEGLLEKGSLIVRRAYADWNRFRDLKRRYHDSGFELIDIPRKFHSGKSCADIKLAVDAIELSFSKQHVDTFALLSGDADLSPLVSKLRENGKQVIGIGPQNSASKVLIDCCDQYLYPADFIRSVEIGGEVGELTPERAKAFAMVIDAIRTLSAENKDRIWGSMIKQKIQRDVPSFSEGTYGYSAFSDLLEDAERCKIIRLERDDRSGSYVVTDFREL